MDKELSDETFDRRTVNLPGNIATYVDIKKNSSVDVIVLHEHLGLQNYVRVMAQALTNNEYSMFYPNLFGESEE